MKKFFKLWWGRVAFFIVEGFFYLDRWTRFFCQRYIFIAVVAFLFLIASAGWYHAIESIQAQKALYKSAVFRATLQDQRFQQHNIHLTRHQKIINKYFDTTSVLYRIPDEPFDTGAFYGRR